MGYGKISDALWHDDKIRALSERGRYFFLYLCTCPHGNRLGLFVLAHGYAASDLSCGVDVRTGDAIEWEALHVTEVLSELRDRGRIGWHVDTRTVFVRHYLRHNTLLNKSVVSGALNDLRSVPDTPLLADLLEAVKEGQEGPAGPIRSFYEPLQEEIERRIRAMGLDGVVEPHSHNAGHNAEHSADQALRARARDLPLPDLPLPSRTEPDLPDPPLPGRAEHGGEDDETPVIGLEEQITRAIPRARENIVAIHGGTDEPVEIEGHQVGVGIEIRAFRRICRRGQEPPEIIAEAIRFLPEVATLEPPVSLARWGADDGPELFAQCVHRAYKAAPPTYTDRPAGIRPFPTQTRAQADERREELRGQIEKLKAGEAGV